MQTNRPLKLLFLHATWHKSSEYEVHRLLAENADREKVDCYFIWQTHPSAAAVNWLSQLAQPDHMFAYDFGRDWGMGIRSTSGKFRRALLMLRRFPSALRQTIRVIRTIRPDAIYTSQQFYEVALGHWLSLLFRIPHVIHISYPVGHWLGKQTLRAIRKSSYLIACSEFVRETAVSSGIPPQNIHTLHHGADLKVYDIVGDPTSIRQEFNWPVDTPLVVTAARLDPGKGHEVLLEAFAKVHTALPEARLLLCGAGSTGTGYSETIKQQASKLGLDGLVQFAGFRSDLPRLLAGANVFCLPTENDALPLVFLAAMAAGLPVVGCRSGGVPEMVAHSVHGLLAEPGDVEGIAGYLVKLLRDPELAQQLGKAGRRHAQEHYTPGKVAARWATLLHSFVPRPLSRRTPVSAQASLPYLRMNNEQ